VTDAAQEASDEPLAERTLSPGQAISAGLRQPIVLILLLIAFFGAVAGKPLDGFLMLTVAMFLVWDAASGRPLPPPAAGDAARPAGGRTRPAARQLVTALCWAAPGLLYAIVVGGFSRYSWPATIPVVALGCLAVAVGWQGPLRRRAALTGRALSRAWVWAVILVTGGLWELSSLLQQPHLTTDSHAHPTVSALADPLLASHPGRSLAIGGWLLTGYFLAGR
jgi:hypothetical protein